MEKIYRIKGESKTLPCPHCRERHNHGEGEGPRCAHCFAGRMHGHYSIVEVDSEEDLPESVKKVLDSLPRP
jgi:DNA repair photolyase